MSQAFVLEQTNLIFYTIPGEFTCRFSLIILLFVNYLSMFLDKVFVNSDTNKS